MARPAVAVTVFFFLFFFASARSPLTLPGNDVIDRDIPSSLTEIDAKPTIALPSDKQLSDPSESDLIELDPQSVLANPIQIETYSKPAVSAADLPESANSVPLTIVGFRPVNRRFRPYTLRLRRRGCHHGMQALGMMDPRFRSRRGEVSLGDDMIISGENRNFDPMVFHGSESQVPERLIRFHLHRHRRPRFPLSQHHDMLAKNKGFKSAFHPEEEEEREEKKVPKEKEEGGFLKGFRKFLNQFEF